MHTWPKCIYLSSICSGPAVEETRYPLAALTFMLSTRYMTQFRCYKHCLTQNIPPVLLASWHPILGIAMKLWFYYSGYYRDRAGAVTAIF